MLNLAPLPRAVRNALVMRQRQFANPKYISAEDCTALVKGAIIAWKEEIEAELAHRTRPAAEEINEALT